MNAMPTCIQCSLTCRTVSSALQVAFYADIKSLDTSLAGGKTVFTGVTAWIVIPYRAVISCLPICIWQLAL